MKVMLRAVGSFAVTVSLLAACGSDEPSTSGSADPTASCAALCKSASFSGSRVDNQPNEINCFCTGGGGTVAAQACTDTCAKLGKSKAQAFKSTGGAVDACQCS